LGAWIDGDCVRMWRKHRLTELREAVYALAKTATTPLSAET
jgi:hypothetical protein